LLDTPLFSPLLLPLSPMPLTLPPYCQPLSDELELRQLLRDAAFAPPLFSAGFLSPFRRLADYYFIFTLISSPIFVYFRHNTACYFAFLRH
jgi:hypothetical protein